MTQFVNRLLLLARPGGRLQSQRFDLVALLREVAELLQPLAEDGGERIQAVPAEPLFVDAVHVVESQTVMDMIDNALRHTSDGVTVWLAAEVDPDRVRIRIDDDGCGLPLDGAPRGSGLGMELNRRMAVMLDGLIEWTERPGGGTRVQIELPR
jgi:signal transduction histidine kinase